MKQFVRPSMLGFVNPPMDADVRGENGQTGLMVLCFSGGKSPALPGNGRKKCAGRKDND